MVTITDSRIRHTVFETIYDAINADKSTYNGSSTPSLYGGHPDWNSISFPCIIVNPVNVDEDEYTVDTVRGSTTKGIVVVVEVFGKSNKDIDNLSDGISNTMRSVIEQGLFLVGVSEDDGVLIPNDGKLKQKSLTFSFKRR